MNKPLDLNKPVQTRDGRKAKIIYKDHKTSGDHKLICLVTEEDGDEYIGTRKIDGSYFDKESRHDLINTPEKAIVYRRVYSDGRYGERETGMGYTQDKWTLAPVCYIKETIIDNKLVKIEVVDL